jgi:hypothetical protein
MKYVILVTNALVGCGSPTATPATAPHSEPSASAAPSHASKAEAAAPAQPKPTKADAGGAVQERLARTSPPPGVSPLSVDEQGYAKTKCDALLKAVEREAKKRKGKADAVELAIGVLKNPPKASGVDVAKCAALLIRDLETYRAKTIEIEALQTLKRIGVGLGSALTREPPGVCPSAPPTPKRLEALQTGPTETKPADWNSDGWRCAGFAAAGPIRFQYELRTDQKAKRYEIIARGYPGSSEQPTELVFRVPFGSGEPDLTQPIYRR